MTLRPFRKPGAWFALVGLTLASFALAAAPASALPQDFYITKVSTSPAPLQPGMPGTITIDTSLNIDPDAVFTITNPAVTATLATVSSVVIGPATHAVLTVDVPTGLSGAYPLLATNGTTVVSNAWVLIGTTAGTYHSVAPVRALDTRTATGWPAALASGDAATVHVAGLGAIPTTGVTAIVTTLTAVASTGSGYLSAFASGEARPNVSNLNFTPGAVIPNQAVIPVGADGSVAVFNFGGRTDVLLDVVGWYGDDTTTLGQTYATNNGVRVFDTRGTTKLAARSTTRVVIPITNSVGLRDRRAIQANVTVTRPEATGYLTVYPDGIARPNTSINNFVSGASSASSAIIQTSDAGAINIYNGSDGAIDVIIDVRGGYYDHAAFPYRFESTSPFRIADTRQPDAGGPVNGDEVLTVVPQAGTVANHASIIVGNITAVEPAGAGYLNVTHGGIYFLPDLVATSIVNFVEGQTVANAFTSQIAADQSIVVYNSDSPTDVIVDVFGWFAI